MADHPAVPRAGDDRAPAVVSALLLVVVLALLGGLVGLVALGRGGLPGAPDASGAAGAGPGSAASAAPSAGDFLYSAASDAPPIDLLDPDARPFSLASLRGEQVLVFFGYTHCPDVCPATIGTIGQVLAKVGSGTKAVFVSIDPERDTTAWLKEFVRFMPAGFTALTGTAAQVRTTADAWGVRYARVETDSADAYSMSHTADVFVVDAAGRLRGHFPFGTGPEAMVATLEAVAASTPPSPSASAPSAPRQPGAAATPVPTATTAREATAGLRPELVSTSVWAGRTPVILALNDVTGRLDDPSIRATVRLAAPDGSPAGPVVEATAVQPRGVPRVSYVAEIDVPSPGSWSLAVTAFTGGSTLSGTLALTALDPGATAAIGAAAPTVRTPTLDDVGGDARAITTDPAPDLRLYRTSTTDALAAHEPFVLVVDSTRFRVTPVCGKAVVMARYLLDRWGDVAFVHLEPFRYSVVMDTAVLDGDLANPPVAPTAAAWGIDTAPWDALSMPWVFVVDGSGIVRAKYQGLMGSDDVDVMLALVTGDR